MTLPETGVAKAASETTHVVGNGAVSRGADGGHIPNGPPPTCGSVSDHEEPDRDDRHDGRRPPTAGDHRHGSVSRSDRHRLHR